MNEPQKKKKELSFEEAFARLEDILEQMNSGAVGLDESLKLYEEADQYIRACSKQLNEAERKIEILIKNREGELALGEDQQPLTQEFSPNAEQ
ncbi:MAG: exodeoxyribonuclease VII small subunit [Waddliaceae bacterium]